MNQHQPATATATLSELKKVEGRLASLNKSVTNMRNQQVRDQQRTLEIERENMIG